VLFAVGVCIASIELHEIEIGAADTKPDLSFLVFVANRDSDDVAVIDVRTDRIIKRFRVGAAPHMTIVGKSPLTYTTGTGTNDLTILDASSLEVVGRIPLPGKGPEHGTISPDGRRLFVANVTGGSVAVVDLQSRQPARLLKGLARPHNIAFSADGSKAFIAQAASAELVVVDVARLAVAKRIRLARLPGRTLDEGQGVNNAIPVHGTTLLAATVTAANALVLLDTARDAVVATIRVGQEPWEPYDTPDGRYVLTPNNGDQTISIVDVAKRALLVSLPGGADMTGIVVSADSRKAYVVSRGDSKIFVLDLVRLAVARVLPVGSTPEVATRTADGTKVYVASSGSGEVAVIDTQRDEVVATIKDVGRFPWALSTIGGYNYCH
jgi:YVTN family beta-propeller protein